MKCCVCHKEFENNYKLEQHCRSSKDDQHKEYVKNNLTNKFICKYCNKEFKTKNNLKIHYLNGKKCSNLYREDVNKPIVFDNKINCVCKYCGKDGFNGFKGLATHRKHSEKCLNSWKKEQEEKDKQTTKVKCEICGEFLRNISNTHLKKHNITQSEYKKRFPKSKIFSDGLLDIQKERREKKIFERFGNDTSFSSISLANCIKRYGEEEGKIFYEKWKNSIGITKEKYIEKYGEEKGLKKYGEWKESLKGKLSLDWYVKKYGEEVGNIKYQERRKIQSKCKKLESYIEKYGEKEGYKIYKKICLKKALNLENAIRLYGEKDGIEKYNLWIESKFDFDSQSKIALEFFQKIKEMFPDDNVYFHNNPREYHKYLKSLKKSCFLDFYMERGNKAIEFYGDYWHANPNKYAPEDIVFFPKQKSIVASEIWEKDNERIEAIKKEHGIEVLIVWEFDYINDEKNVMEIVKKFLS